MKKVAKSYLIAAASLFIAAFGMTSCVDSEGLGGQLETIAVPAQRDTVVEENSILLRTSFSYGVEIEDSTLNVEQLNVVELSSSSADATERRVATNSVMSWNVPATRYVSNREELGVVETEESASALDTTSVKEGGLELRKSNREYAFSFDADTIKVSVKNEKGILGEDTLGYAEISEVSFLGMDCSEDETEDSLVNNIHVNLNVIINVYRENGIELETKEKEVEISFSRVLLVERNDSVQPEPKDTTVVTPDVPDLNPDDSDDDPADEPSDEPAGDEPATGDDDPADEPSDDDPAGDEPATGDDSDKDNDNDDPVVDVTPVEPEKDPEQVNPTPSEQEEEQPKVFEKNTPAEWGEIKGFAVSAAPADNVGGHYAVKAWCLTTSNGAVCGVVGLNDEITLEVILSGNFVTGNYSTEYNSAWWNGNCWRPAVARDEAKGAYYYENGSKKAIVPSFDLKIWGWRGGNYSVYMNDYSYSFGESGELIIQHNGNPTVCLK